MACLFVSLDFLCLYEFRSDVERVFSGGSVPTPLHAPRVPAERTGLDLEVYWQLVPWWGGAGERGARMRYFKASPLNLLLALC